MPTLPGGGSRRVKLLLSELLGLMQMIWDAEILEHAEPEEVKVELSRTEAGTLRAELRGKEWRE